MPLLPASSPYPRVERVGRQSPSGPCSRGESVLHQCLRGRTPDGSGRRSLHGLQCSPELAPARSGSRFGRGASPRTLWGGDVPVRLGLRVLRFERVEQPVSGLPALMSFVTLQQRCSVHYSEKEGQRIGCGRDLAPALPPSPPCHRVRAPNTHRSIAAAVGEWRTSVQTSVTDPRLPTVLQRQIPGLPPGTVTHR